MPEEKKTSPHLVIVTEGGEGALQIAQAFIDAGWNCRLVDPQDFRASLAVVRADYVIYRIGPQTYPFLVSLIEQLPTNKKARLQSILDAFDKIKTYQHLTEYNVPIPKSWVVDRQATFDNEPFVIKVANGNQGNGVGLIKSSDDLQQFLDEFPADHYLAQEFIDMETATDMRLFVVGDRVVAAMERSSKGDDFRSNIHLGGVAKDYTPTEQEKQLAIRASQAFKLDFSGVDIIHKGGIPLVIEVNPSPGLFVGEVTKIDVVAAIVEHFRNRPADHNHVY